MVAASHIRASRRVLPALAIALAWLAGCDDESSQGRGRGFADSPASGGAAPGGAQGEGAGDAQSGPASLAFRDDDFVESLRNRDPFRSYTSAMRADAPDDITRRVIMPTTAVEEMRLIGIVTGMPRPKAMLLDPEGVGHVVERGDYIGRPKVIQATGSIAMTLNWRVDRIRENEVVLTQQDPGDPTRSALTKIITLREEVASK
jgi:hypothetical protein